MATPTNEHVEALAAAMSARPLDHYRHGGEHEPPAVVAMKKRAERVLVAIRTDPEVQDAMLAALAAGGRLVEEEGLWPCPSRHYDRDHNGEWCDEACRSYEGHAGDHECVSGRHWPRTADDLPRKVHWIEPEWREVPDA